MYPSGEALIDRATVGIVGAKRYYATTSTLLRALSAAVLWPRRKESGT